jgi:hypothetical protein
MTKLEGSAHLSCRYRGWTEPRSNSEFFHSFPCRYPPKV